MSVLRRLFVRRCPSGLAAAAKRPLSSTSATATSDVPPSFASVQKDLAFLPEVKEAEELSSGKGGGGGKVVLQRAIPLLQRAEEILESSMGRANLMALAVRSRRASACLRLGDFASAEKVLRALDAELELGRHSAGDVVGTRLLLGGSLLLQGRVEEALRHSQATLELVESKAESYTSLLSRACQLVGVCHLYHLQGAHGGDDASYDMLQKAARLAGEAVWQCRTGSSLGMFHWYQHEQRAAADVKEAVAVWEETIEGLERPEEGSEAGRGVSLAEAELWLNLAEAHLWDGGPGKPRDLAKAEEAASKALKLQESSKQEGGQEEDDDPRLGRTLAVVARHRHLIGQAVSAEGLFRAAVDSLDTQAAAASPALRYELQSALRHYSQLLKDWEKRERDAEQLERRAEQVPVLVLHPRVPVRSAIFIEGAWAGHPA